MRRSVILIIMLAVSFTGCKKIPGLSDEPFFIEARNIQAMAVWVNIAPENNDFHFYYNVVSVDGYYGEFNGSDAELVSYTDKVLKKEWEDAYKDRFSFSDSFLTLGADCAKISQLSPDTEYFIFAYPYDGNDNPVQKLVKLRFRTSSYTPSELDFTVTLNGSVLSVHPSNDVDSYFWLYDSKEVIKNEYAGSPWIFYQYLVHMYEEYEFIADHIVRGDDFEDISIFYNLKPGDEFFLAGAAYNNGINGPDRYYSVKYAGPGLPGTVEPYSEPR